MQRDENGDLHQIAYAGRQLTPAEKNYDTTNREGLAVYWALWKKFRYYVEGYHFELQTDHAALKEILSTAEPRGRIARWIDKLQHYDYTITHRPGKELKVVDALSRDPAYSTQSN